MSLPDTGSFQLIFNIEGNKLIHSINNAASNS